MTKAEALAALAENHHDELQAAQSVAIERAFAEGDHEPDEYEVHNALVCIRRALGQPSPSFDEMKVRLRNAE